MSTQKLTGTHQVEMVSRAGVADASSALLPGSATKWCGEDGQWLQQRDSSSSSRRHVTHCSIAVGTEEEAFHVGPPSTNQFHFHLWYLSTWNETTFQPQGARGGEKDPGQPVQVFREDEQGAAVQQVRWRQRHFPKGGGGIRLILTDVHWCIFWLRCRSSLQPQLGRLVVLGRRSGRNLHLPELPQLFSRFRSHRWVRWLKQGACQRSDTQGCQTHLLVLLSEKATKYCGEDGQWFRHPDTNRTWSNYTLCNENTSAKLRVGLPHGPRTSI